MALQQNYTSGVLTATENAVTFTKELLMQGALQSTVAGSYSETALTRPVWTCDSPAKLVAVYERHSVVGSTTMQIVKALGSTPLGSGAPVLSAALPVAVINITQSGTVFNSTSLNQFAVGDQVGVQWGTPGAVAPTGAITLVLQRL